MTEALAAAADARDVSPRPRRAGAPLAMRANDFRVGKGEFRRLLSSDLVTLGRYRWVAAGTAAMGGHAQREHGIVMPTGAPFVLHHPRGDTIIDANTFCFLNRAVTYHASHPFGPENSGVVVLVRSQPLLEALQACGPGVEADPDRPFPLVWAPSSARSYLAARLLGRLSRPTSRPDRMRFEELALQLAAGALAALVRRVRSRSPPDAPGRDRRIEIREAVKNCLARQFIERISLSATPEQLGLSASYVSHVFKSETGIPVCRYRQQLRLRHALNRMLGARTDLARLALALGFSSHSHFTQSFRAEFGIAPGPLRRTAAGRDGRVLARVADLLAGEGRDADAARIAEQLTRRSRAGSGRSASLLED